MITIIAGSRSINKIEFLDIAIKNSGIEITEVISGGATGVDMLAVTWARKNKIPYKIIWAKWNHIYVPGAVVKKDRRGKMYNVLAGHMRNEEMAKIAQALIAVWDGKSGGTKNMIENAKKYNLQIHVETFDVSSNRPDSKS